MPMEIRRLAEKIMVNSIEIAELNGKSFNSLAASAIYMACLITNIRLVRTKKDIADICGSSEATLISTLKIMRKNQQQLIN
jgi:transcription initiation factor TFIIIB Brf1 subunit/transcription initiation factor TFIIB